MAYRLVFVFIIQLLFNSTLIAGTTLPAPQIITSAQNFKTFQNFFKFTDTLAPNKGLAEWAQWSADHISKKFTPANLRIDGMKVFVTGLKEPFEFSNDGLTVSYKGIAVQSEPGMTPTKAIEKFQKSWSHFREFKVHNGAHSLINLLNTNRAYADGITEALDQHDFTNISPLMIALGSIGSLMGPIGLATGISVGSLLNHYWCVGKMIYFDYDKTGNKVKDSKLECINGKPVLTHEFQSNGYKPAGLTEVQIKQMDATLTEICKNPAAVAEYNQVIFYFKKKIFSGDAKFFEVNAAARTPLGNPMGDSAPSVR